MSIDGHLLVAVARYTRTHAPYFQCKERQVPCDSRSVRWTSGGDDSVEGSSRDVAPGCGVGRAAGEGRGRTRRRQMTPVARPPRSVHPRPYTRCSTVLFLRVLAYAHKHLYTRDAVGYARTFARVCAYIRSDCTS